MNLKKIGKVFTSKFVGTGPSSYEKRVYRPAVPQRLRNDGLHEGFPRIPAGPSCCRLLDGCSVFFNLFKFRCSRFGNTVFVGHWQHLEGQVHCPMFVGFSHCSILGNISVSMDSRRPFRPYKP